MAVLGRPPRRVAVRPWGVGPFPLAPPLRNRGGGEGGGGYARPGCAGRLTRASRRAASASISSVLQNANRTRRRPSSGRLKKLEPGTGATPISLLSQKENSSSGSSETAEQSAST